MFFLSCIDSVSKNLWLCTGDKGEIGPKGIQGEIGPQVRSFILKFAQCYIVFNYRDSKVILAKKETQDLLDQKAVIWIYFYHYCIA